MAKIINLNFWKCLKISRIVATSGSRKLRLALYFFFFCTLYTFLNHVYLPGPFNFYFLNLLQSYTSLGLAHLSGSVWTSLGSAASACGPQVATSCGRNEAPGEQPAHSEPFSSVLHYRTLQLYQALPFSVITKSTYSRLPGIL